MKVQTRTISEQHNIKTAVCINKIINLKLDENKQYIIKIAVNENAAEVTPVLKKVKAKLEQKTKWFFAFSIITKSGDKRIEIISKFEYIRNPSMIEVII